jgi:hypothetical protein
VLEAVYLSILHLKVFLACETQRLGGVLRTLGMSVKEVETREKPCEYSI